MPSRRDFLKMSAVAGASFALPGGNMLALANSAVPPPFKVPLKIPGVMRPVRSDGDRDYYEVTMCKARRQILPGKRTTIWGFDGRFPGPTIKAERGREIVIRRKNQLHVPTTTHLHGGEVPWRSDGHPSLPIAPGEAYDYVYPNTQEAATLWYHDHLCKETSRNNYMGLSGLYIIEDEAEADLNLPKGKYDIPLVLQDRRFKKDGSFRFRDRVNAIPGNVYLVNGRPMPFLEVANRKYRFRILNASHSRGYHLALDNGDPLVQIASDQGLLTAPAPAASIPLWPAERAEVVIDFSKYPEGTKIVLQDLDPNDPTKTRPIMRFEVARTEADDSSLPAVLRPIERLLPGPSTTFREFELSKDLSTNKWVINGKPFDASRIDIEPRLGDTEVWTFINRSSMPHPMHVHLVRFQLLERSNGPIAPGEMGWKDTVRVDAAATSTRIIMRFDGTHTGKYMFHCHNLAHEDHSMMGQMLVRPPEGETKQKSGFEGGYVGRNKSSASLAYKCDLPG